MGYHKKCGKEVALLHKIYSSLKDSEKSKVIKLLDDYVDNMNQQRDKEDYRYIIELLLVNGLSVRKIAIDMGITHRLIYRKINRMYSDILDVLSQFNSTHEGGN